MFDSLESGFIPICLLVIAASWFIAGLRPVWRVWVLSIVAPVAVAVAWGFLPRLPALFTSLQSGEESWVPWIILAIFAWSAVAVPVGAVAVFVFYQVRKRKSRGN